MVLALHGQHLIAGQWIGGTTPFQSSPASGEPHAVCSGNALIVDQAVCAADAAFASFAATSRERRAVFLEHIAEEIEARGAIITEIASRETNLPAARLEGERGRTTGQLRLFAAHIRQGGYLDIRHDEALPDRAPLARPDLRLIQRPIGPVAVFGASNFPLAFSVAGGDTASALAAGCPVVVKGHEAHPGTSEIVAQAILAAIKRSDLDPGIFSLVHGGNRDTSIALVTHPLIKAVGFTGSLAAGRALFDHCARRPVPIPFFGELGSVNPMFLLPQAIAKRGNGIATGWAASLTMGAGQFCTNPGIAVMLERQAAPFANDVVMGLKNVPAQGMLTDGIAASYVAGKARVAQVAGLQELISSPCQGRSATPALYMVSAKEWLKSPELAEEVFGPLGLIVTVEDEDEMVRIAQSFQGQLTATLHMDSGDSDLARRLLPILERMAGRVMANGFPTGVEVCDSMVHGGPYPASTNFGATSVGTMAIRRWLRMVCYQNIPVDLLDVDLS